MFQKWKTLQGANPAGWGENQMEKLCCLIVQAALALCVGSKPELWEGDVLPRVGESGFLMIPPTMPEDPLSRTLFRPHRVSCLDLKKTPGTAKVFLFVTFLEDSLGAGHWVSFQGFAGLKSQSNHGR